MKCRVRCPIELCSKGPSPLNINEVGRSNTKSNSEEKLALQARSQCYLRTGRAGLAAHN